MVERFVPHQVSFDDVKKISCINNYILGISTCIAISTALFEKAIKQYENINDGLNAMSTVLIGLYIVFDIIGNYCLSKAETKRRLDFIDNSFNTNLSGKKSVGYFSNSYIEPGLYKMAVNCFENSLFSYNVSKRMIKPLLIKNLAIISIFIISAALGDKQIVILIFQLSLPVLLFQQVVKLFIYSSNNEKVLLNFQQLFEDLKSHQFEKKTPEVIRNIIHYESNISWAAIPLDSQIFEELNPQLSADWDELKKTYEIDQV